MNIMPLGDVFALINEKSKSCSDIYVPANDLHFKNLKTLKIGNQDHKLRPSAQVLMSTEIGLPFKCLNNCPEDMQQVNLNHWLAKHTNQHLLIRLDGEDVRAVFRPEDKPLEHSEVIDCIKDFGFSYSTPVQILMNSEFMTLSLLETDNSFKLNGDEIVPGISVFNSEVGQTYFSVSACSLRLVCNNGIIAKPQISSSSRDVSAKILHALPNVFGDVYSELDHHQHQLRVSKETFVKDPLETIHFFAGDLDLEPIEYEAVKGGFDIEPGKSIFHIIHAYARGAQNEKLAIDSAYKLQKAAGQILETLG